MKFLLQKFINLCIFWIRVCDTPGEYPDKLKVESVHIKGNDHNYIKKKYKKYIKKSVFDDIIKNAYMDTVG